MNFIDDIKKKGCNLRIDMSSVDHLKSTCEIYTPGGWWLVGRVRSDLNLKDSTPEAILKDLDKQYIESEMTWRLDVQLRAVKEGFALKD